MIASISKQPDAIHVYFTASNEQEEALVLDVANMFDSKKFQVIPMVMRPQEFIFKGRKKKDPWCICLLLQPKTAS